MHCFIPYVVGGNEQTPIQAENESALAFLVALSREGRGEPTALVKAHYPFRVYTVDGEKIVFDLLGYSESDKRLLLPKDLSEILGECEKLENSEDKQVWLNTVITLMSEEQEYDTVSVKGLVEQEAIVDYLLEASGAEEGDSILFEPLYTSRHFSATQKKLKKVHEETLERIESTEHTKKRLEAIEHAIREEHEKQLDAQQKESMERLEALVMEKDNAFKDLDKTLKKENKAIDEEIRGIIQAKQLEIEEITRETMELEKRAAEGDRDARRAIGDQNKAVKQLTREIQENENRRIKQVSENESRAESEKMAWESKIESEKLQNETRLAEMVERHGKTIESCKSIFEKMGAVETTLEEDLRKISRLLEIKYKKGETLYLPFYLFRYDEGYGHYPPVRVSFESGVKKTLKLLFAGNLGQRIDQNIQPQTDAFSQLLDRVAGALVAETPLSRQIEEAEIELDMLKDREILDRIEVGLFHSMEREWISEKDYIVAQRYLVHQLDALNGGNLYKKREVVVEPVDTGEIMVQAESV